MQRIIFLTEWEGKKIKIFIFGDYDFLAKLYGISGAAGLYPYLWCHASKASFEKYNVSEDEARSLNTLRKDHASFKTIGQGIKKNVSKFHNCLHLPIIDADIDRVTPPYLHILLGILPKHHKALEDAVHEIENNIRATTLLNSKPFADKCPRKCLLNSKSFANKCHSGAS